MKPRTGIYFISTVLGILVGLFCQKAMALTNVHYDLASLAYMSDTVVELEIKEKSDLKIAKLYKGKIGEDKNFVGIINTYLKGSWDGKMSYSSIIDSTKDQYKSIGNPMSVILFLRDGEPVHISGIKWLFDKGIIVSYCLSSYVKCSLILDNQPELIQLPEGEPYTPKDIRNDLLLSLKRVNDFEMAKKLKDAESLKNLIKEFPKEGCTAYSNFDACNPKIWKDGDLISKEIKSIIGKME